MISTNQRRPDQQALERHEDNEDIAHVRGRGRVAAQRNDRPDDQATSSTAPAMMPAIVQRCLRSAACSAAGCGAFLPGRGVQACFRSLLDHYSIN